jgi:peroxiredoxin Q/BCP
MGLFNWLGSGTVGEPLEVGQAAPDVIGNDESGNPVRFADFYHDGYTLIYFFPKADTPGCTAQACSLRDEFEELRVLGVRIFGVSADSAISQKRFKDKHQLPFPLVNDDQRRLSQAFGVPTILGMTHRQTFLVKEGKIVWRDLRASTRWQARDVIDAVKSLAPS